MGGAQPRRAQAQVPARSLLGAAGSMHEDEAPAGRQGRAAAAWRSHEGWTSRRDATRAGAWRAGRLPLSLSRRRCARQVRPPEARGAAVSATVAVAFAW